MGIRSARTIEDLVEHTVRGLRRRGRIDVGPEDSDEAVDEAALAIKLVAVWAGATADLLAVSAGRDRLAAAVGQLALAEGDDAVRANRDLRLDLAVPREAEGELDVEPAVVVVLLPVRDLGARVGDLNPREGKVLVDAARGGLPENAATRSGEARVEQRCVHAPDRSGRPGRRTG